MTVQELYRQIDGDYEAAKRVMMTDQMISMFIVRIIQDPSYGKLEAAAETMDPQAMFDAAHALKGVAATLGLTKLSELASQLCEEFRSGKARTMSDVEVKEKMEEIRALHTLTLEGVRAFKGN